MDTLSHRKRHALNISRAFQAWNSDLGGLVRFLLPFRVHTEQNILVLLNERTFECKFLYLRIIL